METCTNIYDFIKYCETVNLDSNELFLLSAITASLTKENFLEDVNKCLTIYFKWLKQSVDEEYYNFAATINKAKSNEIKYYNELGKAVLKKSILKDIKAIDAELKTKYLDNK